MRNNLWNLQ